MQVHLIWSDSSLVVTPSFPALEKEVLTIEVKRLVQNEKEPWKRDVRKYKEKMFSTEEGTKTRTIRTPQGFLDEVVGWLTTNKHEPVIHDRRSPLPGPRFDLMNGFRFSQRELLESALVQQRSGLIGAPTRYGKLYLILNTVRAFPNTTTVITMPGVDLVRQTYQKLKESIIGREVVMIGGSSKVQTQSPDITVCSIDSLSKCSYTATKLLLVDEPHAAVTDGRLPILSEFTMARKIGFGATLDGRFDGRDRLLTGVIGPVLAQRTFKEAVKEGAICGITCLMYVMPQTKMFYGSRDRAYKDLLYQNPLVAAVTQKMANEIIPRDWQSLFFIKNEKQADYMLRCLGDDGVVAMAKKLGDKQRKEVFDRMAAGDIKRCLASDIYAQGVTFSDIRVAVNLAGGGPYTNSIQKPGRLAEVREGKKCGILIDFIFPFPDNSRNSASALSYDSKNRFNLYKDRGYDIVFVNSLEQLTNEFNKLK